MPPASLGAGAAGALDLPGGFVRVAGSTSEVRGVLIEGRTTMSRAGVREVGVPAAIVPDLKEHLRRWSEPEPRRIEAVRSGEAREWHDADAAKNAEGA